MVTEIPKIEKVGREWKVDGLTFTTRKEAESYLQEFLALGEKKPIDESKFEEVTNSFEVAIYDFMAGNKKYPNVTSICKALNVSRASFYSWMEGKSIPNEKHTAEIQKLTKWDKTSMFFALRTNIQNKVKSFIPNADHDYVKVDFHEKKKGAA